MIIDAHLHVWSSEIERYPWNPIGGYIPEFDAPIEVFKKEIDVAGVDRAVIVQPTPYGWDNSYLMDVCSADPERFKAVVLVDPESEKNADKLSQLRSMGASGLRVNLHIQPMEIIGTRNFQHLIRRADTLDLPVCFQLTPANISYLEGVFKDFPNTKFILDHLGRPEKASDINNPSFRNFLRGAEYKNVFVKLSGLNYYSKQSAPYQDVWPMLLATKDAFSAERCIWGSDFPFVNQHWSYREQINVFRQDIGFSEDDLAWIMGKTAESIWWRNHA